MSPVRVSNQSGYGLLATVLMVIVFAIMGLVGLSMARQELRTETAVTSREVAFYAAETGLARGLDNWSTPAGLIPTDTFWLLDSGPLPSGANYSVGASRLDDGSAVHATYTIRSEGQARDGRTQQVSLLVATMPVEDPFKAALQVLDSVTLKGTADVTGFDRIPIEWNGPFCTQLDDHKPGVVMVDTTAFERKGGAKAEGAPPLDEDTDTVGFFNFGPITYEELAADADITLADGTVIDDSNPTLPSYTGDGSCNTADPYNWGDPLNPSLPCANWFPTIHVEGDLQLEGNYRGQGLLLVDGDIRAQGGFEFYGPVIVKGDLVSAGNFEIYGGVKGKKADMSVGTSQIYYSACVLQRVLSNTRAARPRALVDRPWFQRR